MIRQIAPQFFTTDLPLTLTYPLQHDAAAGGEFMIARLPLAVGMISL